jgi:hypothetical protein
MAKKMSENVRDLAEAAGEFHQDASEAHSACHDSLGESDGKHIHKFHAEMAKAHAVMAEQCNKIFHDCAKAAIAGVDESEGRIVKRGVTLPATEEEREEYFRKIHEIPGVAPQGVIPDNLRLVQRTGGAPHPPTGAEAEQVSEIFGDSI